MEVFWLLTIPIIVIAAPIIVIAAASWQLFLHSVSDKKIMRPWKQCLAKVDRRMRECRPTPVPRDVFQIFMDASRRYQEALYHYRGTTMWISASVLFFSEVEWGIPDWRSVAAGTDVEALDEFSKSARSAFPSVDEAERLLRRRR